MFRIGEFSRLSQVTVKTLRYYDEIDLLKPAQVDKFTYHRFYTLEQLPHIHRIMVLKELGLSLEQIARMVEGDLPTDHLRGMLALREAEAQQQFAEIQAQLARIRFHIRQIDMEADMSQLDIRIKQVEPVRALTIRFLAKRTMTSNG
jgi:DNA-binding transcriptional MerR regulator